MTSKNEYTIPKSKPLSQMLNADNIMEHHKKSLKIKEQYEKFLVDVKNTLVTESLNYIIQQVLPEKATNTQRKYAEVLCSNFVQENSTDLLLQKFKRTSCLLAETAYVIECSCKKITKNADPSDELSLTIRPSDKKDFYNGLEDLDFSEVVNKIRDRVCDSTEEFIQNNIKDKAQMEKVALKAKEKYEASINKDTDDETASAIKQEHARMMNQGIENIRTARRRNIYEQMVILTSRAALKNENNTNFVTEAGGLDVEKVTSVVDVMYTFLEALNTCKIKKVDEKYLTEVLGSIK